MSPLISLMQNQVKALNEVGIHAAYINSSLYVIHYNMSQSMGNYYQEAGRAERDGESAQCILLFSPQDVIIAKFLLDKKDFSNIEPENIELIRQRDFKRLHSMENYY